MDVVLGHELAESTTYDSADQSRIPKGHWSLAP